MIDNLVSKVKEVLINPNKFFSELKKEKGIHKSFEYFVILSLIGIFLGLIVDLLTQNPIAKMTSQLFGVPLVDTYSVSMLIFVTTIGYFFILLLSLAGAALLHLWILIFGGKGNYKKTYQLYVYSMTPKLILGWIPLVNYFVGIYDLVLLIIGTHKIHKISMKKSILMYVIPSILMILLFFIFMAFFIKTMFANYNY